VIAEQVEYGLLHSTTSLGEDGSNVTAYEVDGFGHANLMDDANIPNLLSFPFIGYNFSSYASIRQWVLSPANPWYFSGTAGEGVGSPHTGANMIWPMSVTLRALTSESDTEILACLETLLRSANNTGFMHESFDKDNVAVFTRPWFAWANTLFGSLITTLAEQRPWLLFGEDSRQY
jgi:meiotically up-regulated gene 157 (Mug157) protein